MNDLSFPFLRLQPLTLLILLFSMTTSLSGEAQKVADNSSKDRSAALNALNSLTQHVNEKKILEAKAIVSHIKSLNTAKANISQDAKLFKAYQSFIALYEDKIGPLWLDGKVLNKKVVKDEDQIHWAAFWIMQNFFDQIYTSDGLNQHLSAIDGFSFKTSDFFPGKVDPSEKRIHGHKVNINGSYPVTWGPPIFHMEKPARKPTGAYLVPGTIATVKVPKSLINKGYEIRVGAHSWDLIKKRKVLRLYRVSAVYPIDKQEIRIANPLGGGIYIEVPYEADAGVVEIEIDNVVRSPYFSLKAFHKTSLKTWQDQERNFKAPWADFQSERFMMQVPTSWIYKLNDPVTLMKDWDKAIGISNRTMGRPEHFGKEIIYAQVDTQLRGRAFHPGYPSGNRGYEPLKDYGGNHDHHLIRGPQYAHSYEFHEQGHGYLFPKYTGDREAAVNLPFVAVLHRGFDVELEEAFRKSRSISNEFVTLDHTAIAWMMSNHFLDKSGMQGYERQYQAKGHAKFVDIARLFGWEVIDNFFKSTNQDHIDGKPWGNNSNDGDKYTLRLSKVAKADLRPLIHFWGIPIEDFESTQAFVKKHRIPASPEVWDLLNRYKNLIPENNHDFREYAKNWWQKEPSAKGFTTERNHAVRWEAYNEKMASNTRACLQDIIDTYFPDGRPKKKKPFFLFRLFEKQKK